MTEAAVRISVPGMGGGSPVATGETLSPALIARKLCDMESTLQGLRSEHRQSTEALGLLAGLLGEMKTLLERIAVGVETSGEKMDAVAVDMKTATRTLNERGWAIEQRIEAVRPAVEGARAAVEADTAARAGAADPTAG